MMTEKKILKKLKDGDLSCDAALKELSKIGYCPALLNDDNGHWAVSYDGFQAVPIGDDPESLSAAYYIKTECWQPSIKKALIFSLED